MPDDVADGRAKLRQFAKDNRARFVQQSMLSINVPEPLSAKVVVKRDGLALELRASQSFFWLRTKVQPRVVISVGQPDRLLGTDRLLTQPRMRGLRVFVRPDRENSLERMWLSEAATSELLVQARLQTNEAIHVVENNVAFVVSSRRNLEDVISQVGQLTRALERLGRSEAAPLDLSVLPPDLAGIVQRFERFAISDDEQREEMTRAMKLDDQDLLLADVVPLLPRINAYLDSLSPAWPEAASKLGDLAQLTAELLVAKQPSVARRRLGRRAN